MEVFVFVLAAGAILAGAFGVVIMRNPVHNALSLVATLFGVAVLFVAQEAHFLAAVQVIVYAGAIVVLFLFVIMLLGVDRVEDLRTEPIVGQRPAAIVAGLALVGFLVLTFVTGTRDDTEVVTGVGPAPGEPSAINVNETNPTGLGRVLFTDYAFAVEITALLLTIAVVGAVVLARRSRDATDDEPLIEVEEPNGDAAEPSGEAAAQLTAGSAQPAEERTRRGEK